MQNIQILSNLPIFNDFLEFMSANVLELCMNTFAFMHNSNFQNFYCPVN